MSLQQRPGSCGTKRASKEEESWKAEARRIDKKLRPFLDKVCQPRLARVVAMVLLVADQVCDVPVLRGRNHRQLSAALDTRNEFKIKAEVGGALCGVLGACMGGARRPLTAGEKRLAGHLKNAATLMDAYDPLARGAWARASLGAAGAEGPRAHLVGTTPLT